MIDDINRIADTASERARAATTLDDLRAIDAEVLGKRSEISSIKQRLGSLDPEERKQVGKAINEARATIEEAVAARRTVLEAEARKLRLEAERLDLTEVVSTRHRGSLHLVTQAMQRLEDVFVGMGFTVAEGPEVESDWYNFGALNFPDGHPARDMYDTLYLEPSATGERPLLRTHTSPVQIRLMESKPPPIYAVMPGRVARRDTADATHMPVFHQIEGLVVDRGITMGDLAGIIDEFAVAYFGPGFSSRLRPSYFPFTEPSAEFDIRRPDGSWLELGGCGMVHPNVFRSVGYDPEEWTGFAFGFGIDRMTAQRAGVDDLRDLFTNDIRFLRQF